MRGADQIGATPRDGGTPVCWPQGWRSLAMAGLGWALAVPAQASLTENLAVSPVAMSLGNAVTADPTGLDAVHFNPAGLTRLTGRVKSDTIFAASIRMHTEFRQPEGFDIGGWKEDPLAGQVSDHNKQAIFLPLVGPPNWRLPLAAGAGMGFAFNQPDSPWTFATAVYIPQAVGVDRSKDPNDPARFDGKRVIIQRLVYASPSVGLKVSDTLSIGFGVPIAHQGFALDTDMRLPNKLVGIFGKLQDAWCGDDGNPLDVFAFGICGGGQEGRLRPFNKAGAMRFEMTAPADPTFNVGVLWEPYDWIGLGAVYQGGSRTVLTGRYNFHAEPMFRKFIDGMYSSLLGPIAAATLGFPTSIPEDQSGNVTMVLPFPTHIQAGLKFKPIDLVQLNADVNWTDWAQWDKLTFNFDQQVKLLQMARLFGQADASKLVIPRGYRSNLHYGFGVQFNIGDRIKVRAGYEPRKTSIPNNKLDLIAPLPDMKVASFGAGIITESGTHIDVGFSYAVGHYHVPPNGSCNLNCDDFFNVIYNPYAGLDISGSTRVRYGGVTISHPF
jgi:long-subunit fatty acid transport protein